jgi:hypothetical protein
MRLLVTLALLIIMVLSTLTSMTILFHFKNVEEGQDYSTYTYEEELKGKGRLLSALCLLIVTSPFMLMGINQLSKSHQAGLHPASSTQQEESSPAKIKAENVGLMTLLFGLPFFATNVILCFTANLVVLILTFILSWWGTWIWFGDRLRAKLAAE